jgi:hypothetical protein
LVVRVLKAVKMKHWVAKEMNEPSTTLMAQQGLVSQLTTELESLEGYPVTEMHELWLLREREQVGENWLVLMHG